MNNEKLESIFNPKKFKGKKDAEFLCKTTIEISEKIKEYLNSSSFLIAMDSIETDSEVFLIKEKLPESEVVERNFINM